MPRAHLDKRLANYGLWVKSSPPPVVLNSFIETQPYSSVYVLSMAALVLQWQS